MDLVYYILNYLSQLIQEFWMSQIVGGGGGGEETVTRNIFNILKLLLFSFLAISDEIELLINLITKWYWDHFGWAKLTFIGTSGKCLFVITIFKMHSWMFENDFYFLFSPFQIKIFFFMKFMKKCIFYCFSRMGLIFPTRVTHRIPLTVVFGDEFVEVSPTRKNNTKRIFSHANFPYIVR